MNNIDTTALNAINNILSQYDCKIKDIDFENRILNITGPSLEAELECANRLEESLSEYIQL